MPSEKYTSALEAWKKWNASVDLTAPLDAQRRSYEEMFVRMSPVASTVTVTQVDAGGVRAEWVQTPESGRRTILFFHGGGYLVGSAAACRGFAAALAEGTRCRVLSVDYRLSPEQPFPSALDDAKSAYRWLRQQGLAPSDVIVSGESAGGGLALALLMSLRDAGEPAPACGVLISPWLDLAVTGDSAKPGASDDPLVTVPTLQIMASLYVGENTRAPLASPLYGSADGLPPLLLMVGGNEVLRDDAIRFSNKAKLAKTETELFVAPGMVHIWPLVAHGSPEAADAIDQVLQFIARPSGASA